MCLGIRTLEVSHWDKQATMSMERTTADIIDELLVLGSQNGDTQAWRQLVNRWQPRFYAQARRLTGHRDGAADVTQDTWMAVMRSIHRLEDPIRFRAWAHRILANKSVDWIRRRQRERKALNTVNDGANPIGQIASPVKNSNPAIKKLREAMKSLPTEHQHLLSMFYIDRMSLLEISEVLSIPLGTVKSRLHSIRQELKQVIEGLTDEGH